MEGATIIIRYQKAKWQVVAPRRSRTIWDLVGLELTQRERNICGISVDNHLGRSVTWNALLPKRPFYPTIWYEPDSRNEHIESECSWRAEEGERNGRDIEQNRRNSLEVAAQRDRQV